METIYSKKNHLEINTSVLFKSSEFKESVMKESAEKFAFIAQTTRYMPEIVLKGNSMNMKIPVTGYLIIKKTKEQVK